MQVRNSVRASGNTHPGLLRDRNEDRFHYDPAGGIFIVIDGVGGQAAGEKAAETALGRIRERLEDETGPVDERVRQAITSGNNEIFRLASLRPEWKGMACGASARASSFKLAASSTSRKERSLSVSSTIDRSTPSSSASAEGEGTKTGSPG